MEQRRRNDTLVKPPGQQDHTQDHPHKITPQLSRTPSRQQMSIGVFSGEALALFRAEQDMDAIRPHAFHFTARAVLTALGAALLWWAPASILGLVVMLIGLICAVSGLLAGDFVPDAIDALSERVHGTATRRAS